MDMSKVNLRGTFLVSACALLAGLALAGGAMAAPATSLTHRTNSDRATMCVGAGGTATQQGSTLQCQLPGCTILCVEGSGCAASGAGCGTYGGGDFLDLKKPKTPKVPRLPTPVPPMRQQ